MTATASGWLVFSALGELVLTAALYDEYGEALDELLELTVGDDYNNRR